MRDLILEAIAGKRLVKFEYQGHVRICEPHVCGRCNGVDEALMYQVDGGSKSGRLPNWRRIRLGLVSDLEVLGDTFAGPRPYPSGQHSSWDDTYGIVR